MGEDLEANESSPLVESPASFDSGADTSTTTSSSDDDIKDELNKPWPATFDRGIQILAGPIMDEKDIDKFTKSPGVRARYQNAVSFPIRRFSGELCRPWKSFSTFSRCCHHLDAKIRILGEDMEHLSPRRLRRCTLQARQRG